MDIISHRSHDITSRGDHEDRSPSMSRSHTMAHHAEVVLAGTRHYFHTTTACRSQKFNFIPLLQPAAHVRETQSKVV